MKEIIFAGIGKIGEICLQAIQKEFETVFIVKQDNENITSLKRKQDIIINSISEIDVPYVFLAGWYSIITKEELIHKKYINIHGSLLPKYRGIHSIYWAIMNGEKELGYTIHEVNEKIDDGNILYQYKFPYKNYTIGEVHEIFYKDLTEKLGKLLYHYIQGNITLIKQNFEDATWVPKRNLEDCLIDFTMSNELLRRFFLALTPPYPRPRIQYKNKLYEIISYKILDKNYYCQLGRVVNCDSDGVWIKTKDGILLIKELYSTSDKIIYQANELISSGYRFL